MMTGGVALSRAHGPRPEVQEYRFPSHFIMLSRAKGPRAARDSISRKLEGYLHMSKKAVNSTVLPMLSSTARNDPDILVTLGVKCGLDEDDVGYLLGVDPDSQRVQGIMARVRSELGVEDEDAAPGKRGGRSRPGKRSLGDF
jgi:hypothetical protein